MVYMVYHNNQVYHGGTSQGCKFLSQNSEFSRRFSSAMYSEGAYYCDRDCGFWWEF